jgi:hypothetical protein
MNGMYLAHDKDSLESWRCFVTTVMNVRSPYNAGNLLTSLRATIFKRGNLFHMKN